MRQPLLLPADRRSARIRSRHGHGVVISCARSPNDRLRQRLSRYGDNLMLRVLLAVVAILLVGEAEAATVNLASPTGTVDMSGDGTNQIPFGGFCGSTSATIPGATNANPCTFEVVVDSSGRIGIQAPPSLPLPSLAATSTLQSTINTTLGSPFQAGGSVGNTGFNALQAGAANTSGNPFFTSVTNTNTNITPGDAVTTTTYGAGSPIIGVPFLWNGTTYDRWKEGAATGAGLMSLTGTLPAFASNPTVVLGAGSASVGTVGLNAGSNTIGALTANQSVNLAQIGGSSPGVTNPLAVAPSPYPLTAVPITASATGTTAATTATLTNVTGHTTYICGFSIRANATAAATGNATVTGTITATMNFTQWTAPLASGLGVTEEVFSPCVPASAVSTSIAVVSAAPGSGGVVSVSAWGYSI